MTFEIADADKGTFIGHYRVEEFKERKNEPHILFSKKKGILKLFISSPSKQIDLTSTKVNTIETDSFKDVKNVEEVALPISLNEIKEKAFENCQNLQVIILDNQDNNQNKRILIQSDAFKDCISLSRVFLSSKRITIEKDAFSDCPNLRAVVFDSKDVKLRGNVFSSSDLTIFINKSSKSKKSIKSYCAKNDINYEEF